MIEIIRVLDVAFSPIPFLYIGGVILFILFGILSVVGLIVFIIVIAVRAQRKKSSSFASKESESKTESIIIDVVDDKSKNEEK
ncbi:MAG: hypothetical protein WC366_02875 [Bacilli bacterium]|jgi:uncharacterized membrane protein